MVKKKVSTTTIKNTLRAKKKKKSSGDLRPSRLLSTSSTLLNLLSTRKACGGVPKGKYILLAGDSDTGKTVLAMSILVEAANNPNFADYDLIHDNAEDGVPMASLVKAIKSKVGDHYQPPRKDKVGVPIHSRTVQDFYDNLKARIALGKPFIYLLDSMDGLDDEQEAKKSEKQRRARETGKQAAGDFGASKAKTNSKELRRCVIGLRKTGSILIIISQLRDNLGFTMGAEKRSRSGGRALKFFARLEVWLNALRQLRKTVRGKQRHVGVLCRAVVKKNHFTGQKGEVEIPIYTDYGVDDLGSCVDFLVDEKEWKKKGKTKIVAKGLNFIGTREALIAHIEAKGLEDKLRAIVERVWLEILEATKPKRKPRY